VLMDQNVSCAVPGVTTIEQIEECAAVMGISFSKGDLDTLKQYQSFLQGRICTMCGDCIGECPYRVPHGDLLRLVMYHDGYENDSLLRESLQMITKQDIRRCSECPTCSIICRRGLDVRAQIKMAQEFIVRS
jgi:ferredoxin